MSHVTAYYHIVFCTKFRKPTIPPAYMEDVYRYINAETLKLNCKLLRIGGISNHIHMLINLNASISLATFIQKIKSHSSGWMRSDSRFSIFEGWASEYYACSISPQQKEPVIQYITGQNEHHISEKMDVELQKLFRFAGLPYSDRNMNG